MIITSMSKVSDLYLSMVSPILCDESRGEGFNLGTGIPLI